MKSDIRSKRFVDALGTRFADAYVAAACLAAACFIAACDGADNFTETPPVMPPPAASVRVQRVLDSAWAREPAIDDTLVLSATYYDAAGMAIPGRPVVWSLERPSLYYSLSADGVVVPLKAGDGASYTYVQATIDGVRGAYPLSYRVLGWILDSTFNTARQRFELSARLAARMPGSNPPLDRRKGLNSDWDAIFALRCRAQGGLELQLSLPSMARSGEVQLLFRGAESIAERWNVSADGYSLTRSDDARQLLVRLVTARDFSLQYSTAVGLTISGVFPGRDPAGVVQRVNQACG